MLHTVSRSTAAHSEPINLDKLVFGWLKRFDLIARLVAWFRPRGWINRNERQRIADYHAACSKKREFEAALFKCHTCELLNMCIDDDCPLVPARRAMMIEARRSANRGAVRTAVVQ